MPSETNAEEAWYRILTEGESTARSARRMFALIPSPPRCKLCNAPFKGPGAILMNLIGREQSSYNPRYCAPCAQFDHPGGAEVVLTMLFADVRDSTAIAETMSPQAYSRLMNRFYNVATDVLVRTDAMVDKLVGDEVIGLYIPGFAGQKHPRKAIDGARDLLQRTGHREKDGPWLPIGVGVHTGMVYAGVVGGEDDRPKDFTVLGDNVNIAARLGAVAGPGEVVISEAAYAAAGLDPAALPRQQVKLKGKREPTSVRIMRLAAP